ncbi:MAG: helix-turn-helix domain-containing protein [Coriobacteriia bacterium]|nr:helix-turn-helix domain-containing protein [Coriobacteriia bacterium]
MADENRIGRLIAGHRERRKLTKAELARRAGVSAPYLSQIESGDRRPSEAVLRQIAGALGIKNIELLEPAGMLSAGDKTLAYNIDRKLADITDLVYRHDEDEAWILQNMLTEHLNDLVRFYGSGPALPAGPEGWDDLNGDDQKLVQRLIDRLLGTNATEEPEA